MSFGQPLWFFALALLPAQNRCTYWVICLNTGLATMTTKKRRSSRSRAPTTVPVAGTSSTPARTPSRRRAAICNSRASASTCRAISGAGGMRSVNED